jgi:hypothetical protein
LCPVGARFEPSVRRNEPTEPVLERLALAMRVAQDQRASVDYRYDLAWEVLTAAPISRGEGARQSLPTLTKLRNDLVHAKSGEAEIYLHNDPQEAAGFDGIWLGRVTERHKHPSYFRVLESVGLLATGDTGERWLYRVCSSRLAEWACDTVAVSRRVSFCRASIVRIPRAP